MDDRSDEPLAAEQSSASMTQQTQNGSLLRDSKGWDGKLRVDKQAMLANPEALVDPEYSDEENILPGEELNLDEGAYKASC